MLCKGERTLLLEQLVNPVDVVEGVIDEELEFWDYPQLVAHTLAYLIADGLLVVVYVFDYLLSLVRWEYAQICPHDAQVGAYPDCADRHQDAMCVLGLALKDVTQFLLYQSCYLALSGGFHIDGCYC